MASGRRQYPFHLIEPKWQRHWDEQGSFRAWNPGERPPAGHPFAERHGTTAPEDVAKFYILDMFPYPSGAGLHVGHPEGYTATDILARYKRARGFHVLHPMGWDAFGLPAEQYAIKTGQHPRKTTEQNIATFKRQIKSLGFSYDWTREIATEEVADGKSEVGDFPVVRKPMRQWMLRITAYAERLLNDLDTIQWSHSLKEMQRNWIGRSEGAEVNFRISDCGLPATDLDE